MLGVHVPPVPLSGAPVRLPVPGRRCIIAEKRPLGSAARPSAVAVPPKLVLPPSDEDWPPSVWPPVSDFARS